MGIFGLFRVNMKIKFSLAILLVLLISCDSHKEIKTGTYLFTSMTRPEIVYRYVFQRVIGYNCSARSLTINVDSSFIYTKVPYTITGIWKKRNDFLILIPTYHKWISDSIKIKDQAYYPKPFKEEPIVFQIKRNLLIRFLELHNHRWIIEKLKFNAP